MLIILQMRKLRHKRFCDLLRRTGGKARMPTQVNETPGTTCCLLQDAVELGRVLPISNQEPIIVLMLALWQL